MTTYNELAGLRVNYLSTDPTLNSGNEGQVWYNSTSGTLKSLVQIKAWSAGGNLPVAKNEAASDGTSTAGWTAGGASGPAGNTGINATEEYSGYTWASGGTLNTSRTGLGGAGFGTQTAAAVSGGYIQPGAGPTRTMYANAEEYNGSAWTSVTSMPTALANVAQCGIQTAGLSFGGGSGYALPSVATTLEYDGTNWTSGGNLNTAGIYQAAGIQTAGLAMQSDSTTGKGTESYNGSTWSTVANRNTARAQIVGFGTQTLATLAGGYTAGPGSPQFTETEQWDGTAWGISTATLGTATRTGMGIGTQGSGTSGVLAGGYQTNYLANTQEFNSTIFSPATGAWASGGNMGTSRYVLMGAGSQTAALGFGGYTSPASTSRQVSTEEYDGSVWAAGGNLGTAGATRGSCGTQTSALTFGGATPSTNYSNITEEYDGTSWSPGGNLTEVKVNGGGAGTQTAGLGFGGQTSGTVWTGNTQEYDGSVWTNGGSMNTARGGISQMGCGTQTAGLGFGGYVPGTGQTSATEEYDGSAWAAGGNLNTSRFNSAGSGIQTAAVAYGGRGGSPLVNTGATELYDGTAWTSVPPMTTARRYMAGLGSGGTQTAGLASGGLSTAITNATEEWSGPQTTVTASTLTTS